MKVVLADSMLAAPADEVFGSRLPLASLDAWTGVLAFSGQIFFDFAGYSTCAIGAAACLGFVLPENFLYPYAAVGFSDFWRRWHITLSSWLRDYLYIPLGGNRQGKPRTYINLMITMLLGGLWHGANWTFVVWGGLHGLFLWIEKYIHDVRKSYKFKLAGDPELVTNSISAPQFLQSSGTSNFILALFTFFLINITWVFFRSPDFGSAWQLLSAMFSVAKGGAAILTTLTIIKVFTIVLLMVICHWLMKNRRVLNVADKLPWWLLGIAWSIIVILIVLSQESSSSFIYFQF